MTTEMQLPPPINSLEELDAQQTELRERYRELVCRVAANEPFNGDEVRTLTAVAGFTMTDFRRHVELASSRKRLADELASHDVNAAGQQYQAARARLEAEAKACDEELQALREKHAQRLQPLREAVEAAHQERLQASKVQSRCVQGLRRTASRRVMCEIASARRAHTQRQETCDGLSDSLHICRKKLAKERAASNPDRGEIERLQQNVERLQAELDAASVAPVPPIRETAFLDWREFDLERPEDE